MDDFLSSDRPPITITVILTNYNHARFLPESLGAICAQTRPADQVIVIDDGSTDDSLAVIREFAARHPTIDVIENGVNRGVQATISRALGAAVGDYVVWAAADDKLLPTFLERGEAMLRRYPEAGLVFSRLATFVDGTGEERHYVGDHDTQITFNLGPEPAYLDRAALLDRLKASYLWLSGNTAIVDRRKLLGVGAFIPALEWHSDWFAFYAVALRHGACVIPETLAMMRVVPDTYSAAGMRDRRRQRSVLAAMLDAFRRPENADLRRALVSRPCIISPFGLTVLRVLATRPPDYDVFLRYATWVVDRKGLKLRRRLAARGGKGLRLRSMLFSVKCLKGALLAATPARWR